MSYDSKLALYYTEMRSIFFSRQLQPRSQGFCPGPTSYPGLIWQRRQPISPGYEVGQGARTETLGTRLKQLYNQSRTQSNACSRVRVGIGSGETESICVRFLTQRLSY